MTASQDFNVGEDLDAGTKEQGPKTTRSRKIFKESNVDKKVRGRYWKQERKVEATWFSGPEVRTRNLHVDPI